MSPGRRKGRGNLPERAQDAEAEGPLGAAKSPEEAAEALGEAAAGSPEPENAGDSPQPGGRRQEGKAAQGRVRSQSA